MGWYAPDYDVYNAFPEIAVNEEPATSWKDRDYALTEACKANLKPSTEPLKVPFEPGSIWSPTMEPDEFDDLLKDVAADLKARREKGHPMARAVAEQRELAEKADAVNQPSHYARFAIEPATYIAANRIEFIPGNAIKYISRAGFKGGPDKEIEDLEKAIRCVQMQIETVKRRRRVAAGANKQDVWKVML